MLIVTEQTARDEGDSQYLWKPTASFYKGSNQPGTTERDFGVISRLGQFVSRFLGIRPRFFPCAENPYKSGLNLQPLLQSILRVQDTSLRTAQGRGWPRQSGDEAIDVWGPPTFPAGGVGPRADSPPRPRSFTIPAPPTPAPRGTRQPAPTCHPHADRGSVGEAGSGLVAAAPPPPVRSLVGGCGGRWRGCGRLRL